MAEDRTNQNPADLSDEVNQEIADMENETHQNLQIDDVDNGNPKPQQPEESETESATAEEQPATAEDAEPEPTRRQREFDGVSRAYDDPMGDFDTKAPKDESDKKKKSGWKIEPPEHKPSKTKSSGAKDIMEVCWGMIMDAYTGTIDFVVDGTIDFVEFVLFATLNRIGKTEKEKAKKNVYMIGSEFYKERTDILAAEKEKIIELNENLEKVAAGIEPEWKLWGKKPNFFDKLVQIYNSARGKPNSAEAAFLAKYGLGKDAETVRGRFAKEEKIFRMAVRIATLEEAVNGSQTAFKTGLDELDKTLDTKYAKSDVFELKADLLRNIKAIEEENGGEEAISGEVAAKLKSMETLISNGNDVSEIKKGVKEEFQDLKQVCETSVNNETMIKEHIRKNSRIKYQQIMENIDKIHDVYKNNPEQIKETIKNYLQSINEASKTAKDATDIVVAPEGKMSKIKMKMKFYGSRAINKAKTAVAGIDDAIQNFDISGEQISARHPAVEKDEFNLTGQQVAAAVRNFNLSR